MDVALFGVKIVLFQHRLQEVAIGGEAGLGCRLKDFSGRKIVRDRGRPEAGIADDGDGRVIVGVGEGNGGLPSRLSLLPLILVVNVEFLELLNGMGKQPFHPLLLLLLPSTNPSFIK